MKFWWQIFKLNYVDICTEQLQAAWAPVSTINPSDAPRERGGGGAPIREDKLESVRFQLHEEACHVARTEPWTTLCSDGEEGSLKQTNMRCKTPSCIFSLNMYSLSYAEIPQFQDTRRFINVFTKASHLTLCWSSLIKNTVTILL
jgi:hypothetical protein